MISNQVLLCSILFKFVAMFIGVCGNIVVIILTRTSKVWSKEKTETSYLVGNLALADLLMCLTFYPAWIVEFTLTIMDIESDQLLFCKFSRSFTFTFLFASVASLLAITVDRYIYIVKPLKYPLIVTRRQVFAVISVIWLIACCIFALLYVEYWIQDIGSRIICVLSHTTAHTFDTLATYIPATIIIILNLRLLLVARRQRKKILAETLPAPDSNTNEEHLNIGRTNVRFFAGIKAAKTFSIVVAVLMFCIVTPNVVGKALIYSGSNPVIRKIWFRIFHYEFYGTNSVVNVFIYIWYETSEVSKSYCKNML